MRTVPACAIAILALFAAIDSSPAAPATPKLAVVTLDPHARQLREDFNATSGSVRLLMIVDPTCGICLRGLADIDDALLAKTDDARLEAFVVHTSVLGAEVKDVAPAAELLHNARVRHYWDPDGAFGREVTRSLELKRGDKPVFAWDVWMVYDAGASLPAEGVPQPALFMHQLPPLRGQPGRPFLDGQVFSAKAHELLARLRAPAAAK